MQSWVLPTWVPKKDSIIREDGLKEGDDAAMEESGLGGECGVLELENGLKIHFYDQSRPVAGDRSLVQLFIRIPMTVRETYFSGCEDPSGEYLSFTSEMGHEIEFRHTKSRYFIAMAEVPAVFEGMKDEFLRANLVYLGKPSFPKMFVMKQYQEWKTSSKWQAAHHRHMDEVEKKERESE
jgi:hypothetical protein